MPILSPLTNTETQKQIPQTPYWIDPECGLWFQSEEQNGFTDQQLGYSDGTRDASAALVRALKANWLKKNIMHAHILDLGSVDTSMRDQWVMQKAAVSDAYSNLSLLPPLGPDNAPYDLITMVHSFQKISATNIPLALLTLHHRLADNGTLFLRMPSHDVKGYERDFTEQHFKTARCFWSLDALLEALYRNITFKIAETYEAGPGQRDYLLKRITKKPTVCIGMIAKNEERDLPVCLDSLRGVADGLCLIDTGSTDRTQMVAEEWAISEGWQCADGKDPKAQTHHYHIAQYFGASEKDEKGDWKLWNFSKARNQYVEWIEKAGFDWVLWMDADDRVENARQIRNACLLDQYTVHGFGIESGGQEWHHHRMWKTSARVRYHGRCHEYPHYGAAPTMLHPGINLRHQTLPIPGMENSNPRNLRILQREFTEEPSARCAFYLGNTFKDAGRPAEAIPAYQARIKYGKAFWDEYMFALLYKGRCERLAGKLDDARRTLLQGVLEHSGWAEFWMELHHVENSANQPWKAIGYALQAKDAPIPPTVLFREHNQYRDQPYRQLSWNYEKLGYVEEALRFALEAKIRIGAKDADWGARIERLKKELSEVRNFDFGEPVEVKKELKVEEPPKPVMKKMPARLVLHRPGALGDVLMTLNHVKALLKKYPGAHIWYKCHESIGKHLKETILSVGCHDVISTTDPMPENATVFNLVGYPLREGYPEKPMQRHLLEYFANELGVACDWHGFDLPMPEKPMGLPKEYITVHPQAGWSMYKNWPKERWEWVIAEVARHDTPVVQIGGPGDAPLRGALYRCGEDFQESLATLAHARMHMGVDSWSNHATNIQWNGKKKKQAVILWGSTQYSAAGYSQNINLSAGLPCQPCFREDPKISQVPRGVCPNPAGQTYENPQHACMQALSVDSVLQAVLQTLQEK